MENLDRHTLAIAIDGFCRKQKWPPSHNSVGNNVKGYYDLKELLREPLGHIDNSFFYLTRELL